jgi:hypothetical protein
MAFRLVAATLALVSSTALFLESGLAYAGSCDAPVLLNQRRDTATIERLEQAWTQAYLSGDTQLERCILSADFTEIMRSGEIKTLKDELAFAAANLGKHLAVLQSPKGSVLLHGRVAVAYGTASLKASDGTSREMRYADYYVWDEDARWHAFFAQQTEVLQH